MAAGRPRQYENRWTFTGVCEKADYDRFMQICNKKGIDASMLYQEWIKKFNLENQGALTQDSQITSWLGDGKETPPEPDHKIPPAYFAPIPEWVRYIHAIKDPTQLVKGKAHSDKIGNIYTAALENLKRTFWQNQGRAQRG